MYRVVNSRDSEQSLFTDSPETASRTTTGLQGPIVRLETAKGCHKGFDLAGALWHLKRQPDVLKNVQVVAQLHRQHLVTHLIGKDRRTIFTPGQVSIESESGVVKETRVDPTASFQGQSFDSPWDMLHVVYFAS